MILIIQGLLLGIGIIVFIMQHRIKRNMSIVASKLVYWTTLLFISLTFNRLLFEIHPKNYYMVNYLNKKTLLCGVSVLMGYIVLQLIAPSHYWRSLIHKFSKPLNIQYHKQEDLGAAVNQVYKKDSYLKEMHFETFLETICWLGMTLAVTTEIFKNVANNIFKMNINYVGSKDTVCILMMLCVPITIRQIIFYLYRIRTIKEEENLTEVEMKFQKKLRKENQKL